MYHNGGLGADLGGEADGVELRLLGGVFIILDYS
jgi:hypothetical protein